MSASAGIPALPEVRPITAGDIRAAMQAGLADLARAPILSLFFGAVFSLTGIAIAWILVSTGSSYWVLPLSAGFPLIGPFAATGLYEISRRLERGRPLDWAGVLGGVWGSGRIAYYAFVAIFVFLAWAWLAHLIFALFVGLTPHSAVSSTGSLFLTTQGIAMLVIGTLVGGTLAAILFCISVISVPLLLDRDIDIISAMVTSVRAVLAAPGPMLAWGVVIVVAVTVAMLPLFIGMVVVFPVLGHASWHIYTRAVPAA